MARPQRNNVDYFPHSVSHGKKMYYIRMTYGNDGYAVWFMLLEHLGKASYHYLDLSDEIEIMYLSSEFKVSETLLKEIINSLVKFGEFDKELWTENNILYNEKFVENISDAYKKRNNNCIDKKSLVELLEAKGIRKPSKSNPKPPKQPLKGYVNPQSKEEYSKEEKNKGINPTKVEPINFDVLLDYLNEKTNKSRRVINPAVRAKYNARLKEGYTKKDIQTAIDNAVKTDFHKQNGFKYLTPEFFSRADKIDLFSQTTEKEYISPEDRLVMNVNAEIERVKNLKK